MRNDFNIDLELSHLLGTPPVARPVLDDAARLVEAATDLTVCGACECPFVLPIDWDEVGSRHWRLTLRCPNCEAFGTVVVEDDVVDAYDIVLEHGAAELARTLHEVAERNAEDEANRFAAALAAGQILPEDF